MHRIAPVPNHNGSQAHCLIEQMMEVHTALEAACHLMRRWQPHGRDYQTGGDYSADRIEFCRRLRLVEELAAQYESEAYTLSTREVRHAISG
jgi:hypothetical protein